MAKNIDLEKVLLEYRDGEKDAATANEELKKMGSTLSIDPNRNVITAEELAGTTISGDLKTINGVVELDIGVGSHEKVHVVNSVLQEADMGESYALAIVGPLYWEVNGNKIGEFKGVLEDRM